MSQELREYNLLEVDGNSEEANYMSVTAALGPQTDRGRRWDVQLTFRTQNGWSYARLTEDQTRDLISTLQRRLDETDEEYTSTGWDVDPKTVSPNGDTDE